MDRQSFGQTFEIDAQTDGWLDGWTKLVCCGGPCGYTREDRGSVLKLNVLFRCVLDSQRLNISFQLELIPPCDSDA